MIKKNPISINLSKNGKVFNFVVVEALNSKTNNAEFEFQNRPLNQLELRDMATHLKITKHAAEKMVLDHTRKYHSGKVIK